MPVVNGEWLGDDGDLCPSCASDNTIQTSPAGDMLCASCGRETP